MAEHLLASLSSFDSAKCSNETQRRAVISAAQGLAAKLQTPTERRIQLTCGIPTLILAIKTLFDMNLFQSWQRAGGGAKDVEELAELSKSAPSFLRRLLVHLVAHHVLDQESESVFVFTEVTATFADPAAESWMKFFDGVVAPQFSGMPAFFREHGYESPNDALNSSFQFSIGQSGKTVYEYFATVPTLGQAFNACMTDYGKYRAHWLDIYPAELLLDDGKEAILVDVGGGIGHDLDRFNDKHPGYADRLVLEDRPEVVSKAICSKSVKIVPHDFFTPQPVKGARAYYMKEIMHNWPDDRAVSILQNIKPAMTPGHSRILINDIVMPLFKPPSSTTFLDMMVMTALAARERTEPEWRQLLEAAGLKLVKIWSSPNAVESVIEAELPER